MNKRKQNKDILQKQFERLSEDSDKIVPRDTVEYSRAMVEIYDRLSEPHPFLIAIFGGILVNFLFGIFKKIRGGGE